MVSPISKLPAGFATPANAVALWSGSNVNDPVVDAIQISHVPLLFLSYGGTGQTACSIPANKMPLMPPFSQGHQPLPAAVALVFSQVGMAKRLRVDSRRLRRPETLRIRVQLVAQLLIAPTPRRALKMYTFPSFAVCQK